MDPPLDHELRWQERDLGRIRHLALSAKCNPVKPARSFGRFTATHASSKPATVLNPAEIVAYTIVLGVTSQFHSSQEPTPYKVLFVSMSAIGLITTFRLLVPIMTTVRLIYDG